MNAKDAIAKWLATPILGEEFGWEDEADDLLRFLTEANLVVVACPPGSRVVVSRESKPCEACDGCGGNCGSLMCHLKDKICPACGGSGVVEATTIHAVEPGRGEMVWESQGGAEVPRWVETWRAVALPDDDFDFDDGDLGGCPYYARYCGLEGHDPEAVCFQMGVCQSAGEPQCVTCEPTEGWRRAAADLPVQPLPEETPQ